VDPSNIEEKLNPRLQPRRQAEMLSKQKAQAVAKKHPDALVIAADTMVVIGTDILGKPVSKEDAKRMLNKLSNTKHTVITGYTIIDTTTEKTITDSTTTDVYMKKLSKDMIDEYVATGEPMDKAGAYGIQEKGDVFIEKIDGDFTTVVGLPLARLAATLKKFGIDVLQ
jgi:septum formation protein